MTLPVWHGALAGGAVLAALALLGWGPSRRSRVALEARVPEQLARALAWGAALWGVVGFALNVAGVPVAAWQLGVLALVGAVLCRALPAPPRDASSAHGATPASAAPNTPPSATNASAPPRDDDLAGQLARLLLPVVLLLAVATTLGQPLRGDGSKFWLPKTADTLRHGVTDTPALQDLAHLGFHRNYPLLGPVLLAPALSLAPPGSHLAAKTVLAGLHAALLVLLVALLRRQGVTGGWLALIALLMPVWVSADPAASPGAGGLMDALLALFLVLLVEAVDALRTRELPAVHDAALWVAAAACVKLEGGVAAALVLGVALLLGPRRDAWWAALLPLLAVALLLGVFLLSVPSSPPITHLPLLRDPENLARRAPVLLTGMLGVLTDVARFGVLPLALLGVAVSRAGRRAGFAWLLLLGVTAFLASVYLSTTMHLGRHLETSVHRLALQWLPAFAFLAARAARSAGDSARVASSAQVAAVEAHAASPAPEHVPESTDGR